MDHYADDLAALVLHLDLHEEIHVGHSAGGGEVARYVGRQGEARVAKVALIGSVTRINTAWRVAFELRKSRAREAGGST
jgi:pimeloyl-ACP methyl ester carboxylesterase